MPRNVAKVALLHWKEKNTEGLVVIAVMVVVVRGGRRGGKWRGRGGRQVTDNQMNTY